MSFSIKSRILKVGFNKYGKHLLIILVLAYFGFGALVYFLQERIIYPAPSQDFNACTLMAGMQSMNFNGTRFYFKELSDSRKRIVFYHGNGNSACDMIFLADTFEKEKISYIFVEYGGYSNDTKSLSGKLILDDVQNINSYIQTLPKKELIVAGESIGTGAASYHAMLYNPEQLLLISPFTSLEDVAKQKLPIYPTSILLKDNFENKKWLNQYFGKVLIIHGSDDTFVPYFMGTELYSSLKTNSKINLSIQGATHNDIYNFKETYKGIEDFIK